jgi:hypothetical protein
MKLPGMQLPMHPKTVIPENRVLEIVMFTLCFLLMYVEVGLVQEFIEVSSI